MENCFGIMPIKKPIVQAKLTTRGNSGVRTMTTWLDKRPDLKKGKVIELDKQRGTLWYVEELYDTVKEATDFDFHRKWDNNNYDKHKGLPI